MHTNKNMQNFKEIFYPLQSQVHEVGDNKADYNFQDGLLYQLDKLCVPKCKKGKCIRKDYTSKMGFSTN